MTITLDLAPEIERKLQTRAAERGLDVPEVIRELLEQSLGIQPNSPLSPEQVVTELRMWIARHGVHGVVIDDSREAIYADE